MGDKVTTHLEINMVQGFSGTNGPVILGHVLTLVVTVLLLGSSCAAIVSRDRGVIRPLVPTAAQRAPGAFTPAAAQPQSPPAFKSKSFRDRLVSGFELEPFVSASRTQEDELGRVDAHWRDRKQVVEQVGADASHQEQQLPNVVSKYSVKLRRIEGAARRCGPECDGSGPGSAGYTGPKSSRVLAESNASEAQVLLAWRRGLDDGATHALTNWNLTVAADFCKWEGVGCDNSTEHVVSIRLAGNKLGGSILSGLSKLPFLTTLDLSFNRLTGDLPADIVNISFLETLDLRYNKLTGNVPPFGNISASLQSLNLYRNKLVGGIPRSLGECRKLGMLNLGRNSLTGDIPLELGALANLQELYLERNKLAGDLPPSLGNCNGLRNLTLGWNKLVGGIPDDYSNLTALEGLYLHGNKLNGTLPEWLADLPNLSYLHLYYNAFTGPIPQLLGHSMQLRSINLSNNSLAGSIPTALVVSSKLFELDLSFNELGGFIPSDLGYLSELQQLRLEQNLLTGPIPVSLRDCSNLTEVVLSNNQLMGPIIDLGNFKQLRTLRLDHNFLNNTIPASLINCIELSELDLSDNNLSGTIPGNIELLTNLTSLGLSGNVLEGSLPELGALRNLRSLNLEKNLFTGEIPSTLGKLGQLQVLDLGSNQFVGNIPPEFAACVNLTKLNLDGNRLNGSVPEALGQLHSLNVLHLQRNRLSGEIPRSFSNLSNLEDFLLSENELRGEIPASLLSVLSQLPGNFSLAYNQLSGLLPKELGLLSRVHSMNLSGNSFRGTIPDEVGDCTSLVRLDLSNTGLTGGIPPSVGRLLSLGLLNVSHNALIGSIPNALGALPQLSQLDLNSNNLSGAIPQSLSSLPKLVFLNVSNNVLQGPVPQDGSFRSLTSASFLGNPGLCGPILLRSCSGDPPLTSSVRGHKRSLSTGAWVGIAFGALGFVALVAASGFLWWRFAPWGRSPQKRGSIIARSELFYPQLRFTVQDLKLATENFSEVNILGTGSLSTVYRGVLPELVLVAVKKFKIPSGVAIPPGFIEELDELGRLRHRNLVAILGHSFEMEIYALVVQFMSNGSLEEHLHRGPTCDLDWPARARVGIGVAKALNYLHHECGSTIVHCDLKPSNVLLDADLEPHLEDFGLSRLIFAHKLMDMTESSVGSSIGYFPPEYGYSPTVSPKGDVYSYGILLLELLTGKKPTIGMFKNGMSLIKWCQASFPDKVLDVLDPTLIGSKETNHKQVNLFMKVALLCATETPDDRPTMRIVLDLLR